jgi:Dolichyl-phosphate-mannose-protein mannosyltransferase
MGGNADNARQANVRLRVWVTVALALGASTLIPWLFMALERDDVEASESPLVLAVARQLAHGPGELYGPYGGGNPLVLIHAPLYYRLAALGAWPLARAGLRPEQAALVAGRAISLAGFAATLAGIFFLARFPGARRIAGLWAVLLAAATPIYGGLFVEVRPDMLGVAIQTWGVVLLLGALQSGRQSERKILIAFACFGAAACVKQQFAVTAGVSMILLASACRARRVRFGTLVGALLVAASVVFMYYRFETGITNGRIAGAVYRAAQACSVVHPATWESARDSILVLCWKCVGLILLLAAAGLAAVPAGAGRAKRLLAWAGTGLIGLVTVLTIVQVFAVTSAISGLVVLGLVVTMVCFLPIGISALGLAWRADGVDVAYGLFFAGELALTAYLFRLSTGAWYNYAVQAMIFASVIAARALARAVDRPRMMRTVLGVSLAAVAVPAFALTDVKEILARRRVEGFLIQKLFERMGARPDAIFFVDRPGFNRVHGRADLVYDPWLYPVFESVKLAEPRSAWLARAIKNGPVRVVVMSSPELGIEGVNETLPVLGCGLRMRIGPWFVWTRERGQENTVAFRGPPNRARAGSASAAAPGHAGRGARPVPTLGRPPQAAPNP